MENSTPMTLEINSRLVPLLKSITNLSEKEQRILLKFIEDKCIKKRKHHRKPYFMAVDYATGNRAYRDFIRDISSSGVFIETRRRFLAGQEIIMSVLFPNRSYQIITGEVVRITPHGIGVRFKPNVTAWKQ
jgi:Tfp pilus assembly protein PilZ